MRYETGGAFRMALESRLRAEALETGIPLVRLRKTVAFDRLLARMMGADQAGRWLLKGGLALQVRMQEGARTTKDIDVLLRDTSQDVTTCWLRPRSSCSGIGSSSRSAHRVR